MHMTHLTKVLGFQKGQSLAAIRGMILHLCGIIEQRLRHEAVETGVTYLNATLVM
jgi:hypothetical protein